MHHVETERLCPLHTAASEMLEFIRLVAIGAEGALSARALLGKIHARALLAKIEGAP